GSSATSAICSAVSNAKITSRTEVPWRHNSAKLMPSASAVAPKGRQRPRAVRSVDMEGEITHQASRRRERISRPSLHVNHPALDLSGVEGAQADGAGQDDMFRLAAIERLILLIARPDETTGCRNLHGPSQRAGQPMAG